MTAAMEASSAVMEANAVVEVLDLINSFLSKVGLPPECVTLTTNCERLKEAELPSELFYRQLRQLCSGLQEKLTADQNTQETKRQKLDSNKNNTNSCLDSSLVQVMADKAEIDRRIAAFIQRKQNDVDLLNKREFCNMVNSQNNNDFSCARVDAEFIPRFGQKSHIKVTQVDNTNSENEAQALSHVSGRQQTGTSRHKEVASSSAVDIGNQAGVIDRLASMETHLGISPGRPVPVDVYQRLQALEQRILYLEGLSPEYFQCGIGRRRVLGLQTEYIGGVVSTLDPPASLNDESLYTTKGVTTAQPSSYKSSHLSLSSREQAGETSNRDVKGLSLEAIDDRINSLKRSLTRGST